MKTYIVEVGGTAKYISSKKSKSNFLTFKKALEDFKQKCDDLNIQGEDITINMEDEKADTALIGNDYVVTLYSEEKTF